MRRTLMLAVCVAAASFAAPSRADAQFLKKLKEQVKEKVQEKVIDKTQEKVMKASGEVVDSVADKTTRHADSAITKSGSALNGVVSRTDRALTSMATGGGESTLARQFATGRLVLDGLRFTADDALDPSCAATIQTIAGLIGGAQGTYVVEGHAADRAVAERRAKAVKSGLVAAGVDATRLFALAQIIADPAAGHIELARMQ